MENNKGNKKPNSKKNTNKKENNKSDYIEKKIIQEKNTSKKSREKKKTKAIIEEYKNKIIKLEEKINNLQKSNINLEMENQKNLMDFQIQAKKFQSKAQEQINAKNKELLAKFEKDKEEFEKFGSQKLIESIIEPILNIDLAVKAGKNQEAVSAYVMGFEMLLNQLYNEFANFGISSIEPKAKDEFNPEEHFAMRTESGGKENTIKEMKKKGFKLHDRVIKPATVVVFKK